MNRTKFKHIKLLQKRLKLRKYSCNHKTFIVMNIYKMETSLNNERKVVLFIHHKLTAMVYESWGVGKVYFFDIAKAKFRI